MRKRSVTLDATAILLVLFCKFHPASTLRLPTPRQYKFSRRTFGRTLLRTAVPVALVSDPKLARAVEETPPQRQLEFVTSPDGLRVADLIVGTGTESTATSRIKIHYKGRLVGKQGWLFEDTYATDDPVRLNLGKDEIVEGLRRGILAGSDLGDLGPMRVGGRRRIVVPSKLGYVDKNVQPVPKDFGRQRRLYSTVMNPTRIQQERQELGGEDLAGVVLFDVELLRVAQT